MTQLEEIGFGLDALVIFRALQKDPVVAALSALCHQNFSDKSGSIQTYCAIAEALYEKAGDLTDYMTELVLSSENLYVRRYGMGEPIPPALQECLHRELRLIGRAACVSSEKLQEYLRAPVPLPQWGTHAVDFDAMYTKRLEEIHHVGFGLYAKYHMFGLDAAGDLIPVGHPDPIRLDQLVGYERERAPVIANTLALLDGKVASNVLLSGDAGTGKSATIKAIANAYDDRGLRLIELNKEQLRFIPKLMEHLSRNPLKFILFIDDLTFGEDDPNFGTLKAILEGGTTARVSNAVIYATSNRRHLVKETFDDGRDKHLNDTIQERVSLSARFGITITFSRPDKKLYLEIVHALAKEAGVSMPEPELNAKAEQFAMTKIGRSARTARQFVDQLANTVGEPT